MWISSDVTIFQHVLPDRIGVVVAEPIAEVVLFAAELSLSADGVESVRIRIDAKSRPRIETFW